MSDQGERDIGLIRAEAAAWLARLRSGSAGLPDQAGFQAWLTEDPLHSDAFEAITATWDLVGGVPISRPMRHIEADHNPRRRTVLLGAALIALGGAGAAFWYRDRPEIYQTSPGEQRRILLSDGSRVVLDTDTIISVRLMEGRRELVLERGRAYFEVAPNPHRPFEVIAGGHHIVALGTAFEVRLDSNLVSATLEHGQIAVSSDADNTRDYVLAPGDRITFKGASATQDRPDLSLVLAWRLGRLGFDRETLEAAVAEMNRYSTQQMVIADPTIAHLTISGLYSAGDNEAFAHSVSAILPVAVEIRRDQIILVASLPRK